MNIDITTTLMDITEILMPLSVESQLLNIISFIYKIDPLGWISWTAS